jgi:putative DNA primase/helicase
MYQIAMICGPRGIGKTWFAMCLLDAVTKGIPFGPWKTVKSVPCLYLEADMPEQDIQARLKVLNSDIERNAPLHIYSDAHANTLGLQRANLLDEEWRYNMKQVLLKLGIKLWVADNLASLTPGIDENAKQDWDPINQWLLDLRFAGISTILMHHTNKTGGQRGTSAREDNIDISIMLKSPHNYEPEEGARFLLKFVKARVAANDLSKITDTQFHLRENEKGQLTWIHGCAKQETSKAVLNLLNGETKQCVIADIAGINKSRVTQIKQWAYNQGYLNKKNKLTPTGYTFVNG